MSHIPFDKTIIGRQFANFRVLRLLGRGGMAEVYYGWDVKLDRPVAIKVIDTRYRHDPEYSQRFVNEARAMAAWHHPNIIPIYYADDKDGYFYFIMEYIRGLDLEQVLNEYTQRSELMPLADAIRIGRAAADALDYAHRQGVIHRDIKPSNLMISEDNRVILTDFGIAMNVQKSIADDVFGSPHYIAPEQARHSSDAVPQSDLYALGVILYEILTGRRPFDDPSATSLAIQHLTREPPFPRQVNPNISPAVEAVLLKALSKLPADRYPSGKELMDALTSAIVIPAETSPFIPAPAAVKGAVEIPLHGLSLRTVEQVVTEYLNAQPPLTTVDAPPVDFETEHPLPRSPLALYGVGCGILLVVGILISMVIFLAINRNRDAVQANAPTLLFQTSTVSGFLNTQVASPLPGTATHAEGATPSQVAVIVPTQTSSLVPQDTPTPSSAPTEAPAATSAPPKKPDGVLFAMYYNETSFYIKNLSGKDISIYPLGFEQLDNKGNPTIQFDGWRWANIYPKFRDGYCLVMEVLDKSGYLNPPECRDRHLVIHKPPANRDYIFWTKEKGSKEFRVLWEDKEVGRCEIKEGYCEVPRP